MFKWIKGIYLAVRYRDYDKHELVELLEMSVKSGRRCAYDLRHAASEIGMLNYRLKVREDDPLNCSALFDERSAHYLKIFNPAGEMKNYRIRLHEEIESLEDKVDRLTKLLAEHNTSTPYDADIPF